MPSFHEIVMTLTSLDFMITALAALAAFATILTLGSPLFAQDKLAVRLKSVATRREELRAQARKELEKGKPLRRVAQGFMKQIVDQFNLQKLLASPNLKHKLAQAGLRGQTPVVTFLFCRMIMPFLLCGGAAVYLFGFNFVHLLPLHKMAICFGAVIAGFYAPGVFVANVKKRRQDSIMRAFPDALDLLLICVEAGMSIEAAFNRVAKEVGTASIELAEELGHTTAELSYLGERRAAYENLGLRTDMLGVKAVCTSLIQAERYGTPLGAALRVMAHENRELRMQAAEKKAAALPAQLTVPMIVFFLPVLFIVILGPAVIRYLATQP
jgi:tight adherence protein C